MNWFRNNGAQANILIGGLVVAAIGILLPAASALLIGVRLSSSVAIPSYLIGLASAGVVGLAAMGKQDLQSRAQTHATDARQFVSDLVPPKATKLAKTAARSTRNVATRAFAPRKPTLVAGSAKPEVKVAKMNQGAVKRPKGPKR